MFPFLPFCYITVAILVLMFIIYIGRDKPPKGEGHQGYVESRDRLYWWHKIWRTKEGEDRDQDWSRD